VPKKNKKQDEQEKEASPVAEESGGVETEPAPPVVEEELETTRALAAKNWDLYLRSQAELDNFRKRAQRDKEDLSRFANESILRELLPVIDNLERAVEHAEKGGADDLLQGVQMTLSQFHKVLEKFGVTPIVAVGEPFDPARHEAVGQVESRDLPPNAVAQELQKGYLLNDRLLRPSMVMIAKAPVGE